MVAKSLSIERALSVVDVTPLISTCSGHDGIKIYIAILFKDASSRHLAAVRAE